MKVVTHAGVFHADDVFSTALLSMVAERNFEDFEVTRVKNTVGINDPSIIIFDIGGGKYDHHQKDNECRECGTPYAAFGKLWRDYAAILGFNDDEMNAFDKAFIMPIDAQDNGYSRNSNLSNVIFGMNPQWDEDASDEHRYEMFMEAVYFAKLILIRQFHNLRSKSNAYKMASELAQNAVNGILVLDKYVPANMFSKFGIKAVIYEDLRGGWSMQCLNGYMLPSEWAGSDKLPEGVKFVHRTRTLGCFNSKENAISIANNCLVLTESSSK